MKIQTRTRQLEKRSLWTESTYTLALVVAGSHRLLANGRKRTRPGRGEQSKNTATVCRRTGEATVAAHPTAGHVLSWSSSVVLDVTATTTRPPPIHSTTCSILCPCHEPDWLGKKKKKKNQKRIIGQPWIYDHPARTLCHELMYTAMCLY